MFDWTGVYEVCVLTTFLPLNLFIPSCKTGQEVAITSPPKKAELLKLLARLQYNKS